MYEGHYETMAESAADWAAEQRGEFRFEVPLGGCTCGRKDCYECAADDDQEDDE